MKLCKQCKKCGKCGKPYTSMSNYAEKCKDFEEIKMPNKKPTDNLSNNSPILSNSEIIKALECCINSLCPNCPLGHHTTGTYNEHCGNELMKYTLDLINRLQAENNDLKRDTIPKLEDSLKRANKYGIATDKENQQLKAEIERLKLEVEAVNELINPLPFKSNFDKAIETAKAEAYKEFAEMLKHKAINIGVNDSIVSTYAIDETYKELVGESNAES